MGFKNEIVPKEEKQNEYFLPGWSSPIRPGFNWTIDKEKNIKLFRFFTCVDCPQEMYFAFLWKGYNMDVLLKNSTYEPDIIEWSLKALTIPEELEDKREEILQDLRDAMKTFGFFGDPPHLFPNSDSETVIIKF